MKKLKVFNIMITVFILSMVLVSCISIGLKPDVLPKEQAGQALAAADEAEATYDDFMYALGVTKDTLQAKPTAENQEKLKNLKNIEDKVLKLHKEYKGLYTEVKSMFDAYVEGADDSALQGKVKELNRVIRRLTIETAIRMMI